VFRVAIAESRVLAVDEAGVIIRHKHRAFNRWRRTRLDGHEFLRRFLQHVLPKGLHKVALASEPPLRGRVRLPAFDARPINATPHDVSGRGRLRVLRDKSSTRRPGQNDEEQDRSYDHAADEHDGDRPLNMAADPGRERSMAAQRKLMQTRSVPH